MLARISHVSQSIYIYIYIYPSFNALAWFPKHPNRFIPLQYSHKQWVSCGFGGYFLSGLYRNENESLSDIVCGYCCKPRTHPEKYGSCYADVGERFTKAGWLGCTSPGYYITSIHRGNRNNSLDNLAWVRCCKMATGIDFTNLEFLHLQN